MNEPRVSVIMPAFNCERYVARAITSILNQTYAPWELLICDDASRDNTLSIVKKLSAEDVRIRVYANQENLGELRTRNRLLELAKGELITFQDADDYSDDRRLELMVAEFSRNERLGLLASQVAYIDDAERIMRISKKPLTYDKVLSSITERNVVGGAIMMIRRTALESVGGKYRKYLDRLPYLDYDLSLLIAERYEAYALPEVLYYYRQHPASSSKIVSVDRIITEEVVKHLARQRRDSGQDDLMCNRLDLVQEYFEELRKPYEADPSRVYREFAASFMFSRLFGRAIKTAWLGVLSRPGYLVNWRTLQYCIRVSLIKWLSFRANRNKYIA
ncbi:MAG TPA: glycosyltransferase [Cyclobacteriaceae bacterium]